MNNRQRRKAKLKTRQEQQGVKVRADEASYGACAAVEAALSAALQAKAGRQEAGLQSIIAGLSNSRAKAMVDLALTRGLYDGIGGAWQRGWQPADLACAANRSISSHARSLLIDLTAAQLREYARATVDETWELQLASLGATVWWERDEQYFDAFAAARSLSRQEAINQAIDVLHFLTSLPKLPLLCPPPGQARRGSLSSVRSDADSRMLDRVRALLAKAEATNFPEEAETYTAKAQELMTRHSIDYAMLATRKPGKQHQPTGRRIAVDNPYEAPKAILLDATAKANRCRAVWTRNFGFSTIVGFAADVAATELLFTSLLLQATAALRIAGSPKDGRTTSFRRSFLTAYANRIGQRLDQASQSAMGSASDAYGRGSLLPVLVSRADAVDDTVEKLFPALSFHSMSVPTNRQGWIAGLAAADRARFDQQLKLQ